MALLTRVTSECLAVFNTFFLTCKTEECCCLQFTNWKVESQEKANKHRDLESLNFFEISDLDIVYWMSVKSTMPAGAKQLFDYGPYQPSHKKLLVTIRSQEFCFPDSLSCLYHWSISEEFCYVFNIHSTFFLFSGHKIFPLLECWCTLTAAELRAVID